MQVVKRDGRSEVVRFDKITKRLGALKDISPVLDVDVTRVAAAVCASIRDGISTVEIDELSAATAAAMTTDHPDYGSLASRTLVSNLQKSTSDSVLATFRKMKSVLDPEFFACVCRNAKDLQSMMRYERDYDFDYFGFKTMERTYLTKMDGVVVERPQHMWLRVAVALWKDDMERVRESYDQLSTRKFTHASPTLFNAGMKCQQLASCFLTGVEEDSIEGIFRTSEFAVCHASVLSPGQFTHDVSKLVVSKPVLQSRIARKFPSTAAASDCTSRASAVRGLRSRAPTACPTGWSPCCASSTPPGCTSINRGAGRGPSRSTSSLTTQISWT